MRNQTILEEIKGELMGKVQQLNFDNVEEKREEINKFLDFLNTLNHLPFESTSSMLGQSTQYLENSISTYSHVIQNVSPEHSTMVGKVFRMERKLAGGFIPDLDNGYYLPEKMVRDMNAEDGDQLVITKERLYNGQKQYLFQIIQKANKPNTNRVELRYCRVEKQAGELVVSESQEGSILFNGVPHTFLLQPKDVQKYNLKEGDIIDVAYFKDHPSYSVKVIYKHEDGIVGMMDEKKWSPEALR